MQVPNSNLQSPVCISHASYNELNETHDIIYICAIAMRLSSLARLKTLMTSEHEVPCQMNIGIEWANEGTCSKERSDMSGRYNNSADKPTVPTGSPCDTPAMSAPDCVKIPPCWCLASLSALCHANRLASEHRVGSFQAQPFGSFHE